MSRGGKIGLGIGITAAVLLIAVLVGLIVSGYLYAFGPFGFMADKRFAKLPGNAKEYALENVQPLEDSLLKGKNIAFLGSSVTLGASSLHTSFADYIAVHAGAEYVKEAVSGTTLAGGSANSYIARMEKMDKNARFDLFVVQFSTNDATKKISLGKVSGRGKEHDTKTVCGAVEHIIEYAEKTWNCPVVFYTNAYFESEEYAAMVGIGVIDLYTDKEFNDITEEERELYMADKIHPTQAGYLKWWTPQMEEYLNVFMAKYTA